jgi:pimeloyl-ACP methyl ester carboxylesterase
MGMTARTIVPRRRHVVGSWSVSWAIHWIVTAIVLTTVVTVPPTAHAQATPASPVTPGQCNVAPIPGGSLGMICIPTVGWNGDLIVWAHGYRAFNESLAFQNLDLPDGTNLPALAQSLGYAFAATTYRQNGLAILQAVDDVRALVVTFRLVTGLAPVHTYMTGASEGGLVTTLLVERSPELFSGGLALCGPIGDFRGQVNYIGDFRVLFDAFFPGVLPGNAIRIPDTLIQNWDAQYVPKIEAALSANPLAALQLTTTAKASIDPGNGASILQTAKEVLWYSTFSTNDATAKLGGNPYGNLLRVYSGSFDDFRLNSTVLRVAPDPVTLVTVPPYQTSGRLTIPLVTMHTTGDDIVPFWHEVLYQLKSRAVGRGRLTQIPVSRYGHCNFTGAEALVAFGLLVQQVTGAQPAGVSQQLDQGQVKRAYDRAAQDATSNLPRDKPQR